MIRVECNGDIIITKGDKGFINFRCANYKLKEGDRVELISKSLGVYISVSEFTEEGFAAIDLEPMHTNRDKGGYCYFIKVITEEGINETVVNGKIIII